MNKATFVIIGGGISGVSCVETLSFLCPEEEIILITESSLIKTVANLVELGKAITKFDVEEKHANDVINKKVKVLIDTLVSIDATSKVITTDMGRIIQYDFLCLCNGARPKLIDDNNKYVLGIRDTESVIEFQNRVSNAKKLLIVGNGGIASEIVYEIKNIELDWVIKDSYISSTFADPAAAKFFHSRLENKGKCVRQSNSTIKRMRYTEERPIASERKGAALGPDWHRKICLSGNVKNLPDTVRIHYGNEIKKLEIVSQEYPVKVTLTNDEIIFCDFVISATGVIPQSNLRCNAEFKLGPDGGIFVDEYMKTSIPGIFAAGDVCYAGWNHATHWFQMRLWTQARQMGAMAGKSMASIFKNEPINQDFCFELFSHVTKLFDYQVVLLGKYNGQDLGNNYEVLLRVTPDKEYVKFVLQDGKLHGAILIGETGLEETAENLILNQLDLTPFGDDILDPNIDIEDFFD